MIKRIISIVIFILIAMAAYRMGMVYFHDQQFKDSVREYAILAGQPPSKSDDTIRAKVIDLARDNEVPLDPDYIEIDRRSSPGVGEKIVIKVSYAVNVALLPGYQRRFDFEYVTP
jgi:hypothetical protein